MNKSIKLVIYIRANSAKIGPPLGTTLGNIGVNTAKFVKEFNEYTKDLPNYFLLKVKIEVSENKNFSFLKQTPRSGLSRPRKQRSFARIHFSISVSK